MSEGKETPRSAIVEAAAPVKRTIFLWASLVCGVALFFLQIAQLLITKNWNPFDASAPVSTENWVAVGVIVLTSLAGALAAGSATVAGSKVDNHIRDVVQNFNTTTTVGSVAPTITSSVNNIYDQRKTVRPALKAPRPSEYEQLKATIVGLPDGLSSLVGDALEKFLAKSAGTHLISDEQHARILALLQADNSAEAEDLRRALEKLKIESDDKLLAAAAREAALTDQHRTAAKLAEDRAQEIVTLKSDLTDAKISVQKAQAFAVEFGKANAKAEEFLVEIERKGLAS